MYTEKHLKSCNLFTAVAFNCAGTKSDYVASNELMTGNNEL